MFKLWLTSTLILAGILATLIVGMPPAHSRLSQPGATASSR